MCTTIVQRYRIEVDAAEALVRKAWATDEALRQQAAKDPDPARLARTRAYKQAAERAKTKIYYHLRRYRRDDAGLGDAAERLRGLAAAGARAADEPARAARDAVVAAHVSIPLGDLGGARDIGVNLVELVPGRQSAPLHWHLREEEHFYVLSGRCVLRVDDARHVMGPGDYVCFPPATRVAHCFENPYDEPCRLLAIGARLSDEIAVYPESKKMKLRALGTIVPLPDDGLDYWHGENVDAPLPSSAAAREREAARKAAAEAERAQQIEDELGAMKKRLGLE